MSENYLVFIEQPLIINAMKLVTSQVKGKCMRDCMTWSPEELVRVQEHLLTFSSQSYIKCKVYNTQNYVWVWIFVWHV
jgi:carotenoid cleavage dioxygenase-like enzyme